MYDGSEKPGAAFGARSAADPAWPQVRRDFSDKALLRRKVLPPSYTNVALASAPGAGAAVAADNGPEAPELAGSSPKKPDAPKKSRPPIMPGGSAGGATSCSSRSEMEALFRPRSGGQVERPRTAERVRAITQISFPARLRLRCSSDAPGPEGPWSAGTLGGAGDAFIMPLDMQRDVRWMVHECAASCTLNQTVTDGSRLSLWALVGQTGESSASTRELEPALALRTRKAELAVEPVNLFLERQSSAGSGARADERSDSDPMRYGEGFRLWTAADGGSRAYLTHGSGGSGGLSWQHQTYGSLAPKCSRFAAHGGELGKPMLMGRPISMVQIDSPPSSDDEDSDSDSSESEIILLRTRARMAKPQARFGVPPTPAASRSLGCGAASFAPPSRTGPPPLRLAGGEPLYSRLAEVGMAFPATLLPPLDNGMP